MFERFKNREPFNRWQPEILRDYCQYGLLPSTNSHGYVLACPPIFESNIYTSARLMQNRDVYDAVHQINVPVRVLRSGIGTSESPNTLMLSPTAPDLADQFQQGEDVVLLDNSHFIPMEAPDVVAGHIRDMMLRMRSY
jgi:lipase